MRVSCVRLILVLVGKKNLGFSMYLYVLCTTYVCTWYQPATQIRMYQYLVSAGRRTFRPWTHTSDDSYMYQLSLVVATATVSYWLYGRIWHLIYRYTLMYKFVYILIYTHVYKNWYTRYIYFLENLVWYRYDVSIWCIISRSGECINFIWIPISTIWLVRYCIWIP